ncbi:MAG: L-seryl-tRNA(Sec) selenium transferase [Myxococcota bacterium]|nr:L-seryl-tRNA(Sec) selenium transferase [Myxococcota bacterium]
MLVSREELSKLPAVGKLVNDSEFQALIEEHGRVLVTDAIRKSIDFARSEILAGRSRPDISAHSVHSWINELKLLSLRDVINATGVVIHTNLGRAPLAESAQKAVAHVSYGYSSLEFSLKTGKRGSRHDHVEGLLTQLLGTPKAIALNNCAGAVFVSLAAICKSKEVIIARGELVEIGGGFRVPDIMTESGALMKEVGTTNRVHIRDYEDAITENTAAILVVHRSNFAILGFTAHPGVAALSELAKKHNIPLLVDVGSGLIAEYEIFGEASKQLRDEPRPQDVLGQGADLVMFSGDKLLGGPQSGIIAGSEELVTKVRSHPLARALRMDKLGLAALEATLMLYRDGKEREIPVIRDLSASATTIEERAHELQALLSRTFSDLSVNVEKGDSVVGGGSLPRVRLPTFLVTLSSPSHSAEVLSGRLRTTRPALIARTVDDKVTLDLRSIPNSSFSMLVEILKESL